jgi:hypothetical protein
MLEQQPDATPATTPGPVPAATRAAVSPSALALAAGGFGLSLIAGLPVAAAVGVGACAWALRVAFAGLVAARRRRKRERPEPIDPYAVPEPWRQFVRESLSAQTRFDQAVDQYRPGPLRQRLDEVKGRVDAAVGECWRVARLGAALDAAAGNLDPDHTSAELRAVQDERQRLLANGPSQSTESLDQTEAALAARLQSGRRVQAASQRAIDRLRVVTAQLNEAVASAAELSLDAADASAAGPLAGRVDSMVSDIEALRKALEEADTAPTPSPPSP